MPDPKKVRVKVKPDLTAQNITPKKFFFQCIKSFKNKTAKEFC